MKQIIKQLIIVVVSFFIILWLQVKDDKRNNRIRTTNYEKFKFPLFVSSMIGFLFTMKGIMECDTDMQNITVISSSTASEIPPSPTKMSATFDAIGNARSNLRADMFEKLAKGNLSRNSISDFNQEIDINPPDF